MRITRFCAVCGHDQHAHCIGVATKQPFCAACYTTSRPVALSYHAFEA